MSNETKTEEKTESTAKKIVIKNNTATTAYPAGRIIVIGGPGVNGMVEGHGTMLTPGYNEIEFSLWDACRDMLATHIEEKLIEAFETSSKDAKGVVTYKPSSLKDLPAAQQAKAVADCNNPTLLEAWRFSSEVPESVRVACEKRLSEIKDYKG